jgi:hypothetical protein
MSLTATGTQRGTEQTASLGSAFRVALSDFYFNSWRLAPANLAWALLLVAILIVAALWLPALLGVALLAVPFAGIQQMTARIARGMGTSLSDFPAGMRRFGAPALTLGVATTILALVFAINAVVGLALANPVGWFIAATATYAEVALAMLLVAAWPIVVDPARDDLSLRRRLELAALVVLARPGRMLVLTVALAAVLLAGVVLLAGIALVGVAYTSLVAARYVLPLADRIEGRAVDLAA